MLDNFHAKGDDDALSVKKTKISVTFEGNICCSTMFFYSLFKILELSSKKLAGSILV